MPAANSQDDSVTLDSSDRIKPDSSKRIVSVDALRGFDMLWILGASEVVRDLYQAYHWRWLEPVYEQMEHTPWSGFTFYDLIFPLFLFIVGVTTVFSLSKYRDEPGRVMRRVIVRFVCLFLLGLIYNGGMSHPWPDVRLAGVLQRIAVCYLVVSLLFLWLRPTTLMLITVALLLLYWGLMAGVSVPGYGRADFAEGHNLANYIDRVALIGRKYDGDHDPEGLLSTIPSIATCLLGLLSGLLLRSDRKPYAKVGFLLLGGAVALAVGLAWGGMLPGVKTPPALRFPVNKKLWTSSFVLVTGGWSALFLGVFYLIIDVWKIRRWELPLLWIGMNAITLYVVTGVFKFRPLADRLVGGSVARALGRNDDIAGAIVSLLLILLLARFLYRRSIFVRV